MFWDRVRQFNVTRQELVDYLKPKGYATWCFCKSQLRDTALMELEKPSNCQDPPSPYPYTRNVCPRNYWGLWERAQYVHYPSIKIPNFKHFPTIATIYKHKGPKKTTKKSKKSEKFRKNHFFEKKSVKGPCQVVNQLLSFYIFSFNIDSILLD